MIQKNDRKKLLNYLVPLSDKIIDQICEHSFFSSKDNLTKKLTHDDVLRFILTNNYGDLYNPDLAWNAITISNLYKKKLEYYANFNVEIQKLKNKGNPVALKLQELETEFNKNPTIYLEEEIAQIKTTLLTTLINNFNYLCDFDHNDIYNSLDENELVINLMSYQDYLDDEEKYVIGLNSKNLNLYVESIYLTDFYKLDKESTINPLFFKEIDTIVKLKYDEYDLINTIYVIPSGESNKINFSAYSLSLEESSAKEYTVHTLNSVTSIPNLKKEKKITPKELILIGDIDYDHMSKINPIESISMTRDSQLATNIDESDILYWGYLPGTKREIEIIDEIAKKTNFNTSIIKGKEATEQSILQVIEKSTENKIIHIATHGFFFPDSSNNKSDNLFISHKNPLLRSGLILSGANKNWKNASLSNLDDDGILTAEEISFMDLSSVDLVVLSACDTGLGDVSNIDGVIGLQSAFRLAGVNKIIMSLWKVPDVETAEFFEYFYKFLLEENLSINQSFRETQRLMKNKYAPFYWAGLVLLE